MGIIAIITTFERTIVYLTFRHLAHPFVVKLRTTFHDDSHLYLVLDCLEGTLQQLFTDYKDHPQFDEAAKKYLLAQIFDAVAYLHTAGVTFRDLKPENVLLSKRGDAVLCDFGCVGVYTSVEK